MSNNNAVQFDNVAGGEIPERANHGKWAPVRAALAGLEVGSGIFIKDVDFGAKPAQRATNLAGAVTKSQYEKLGESIKFSIRQGERGEAKGVFIVRVK